MGGRADAALVRDGSDEARVEGRFVDRRPATRSCSRASSRATAAAARTSTAGSRPRASSPSSARALVDLHGQHAHQSLLDPAVQRARARPVRGRARARRARRATAPRARDARASTTSSRRSAATSTPARARSTCCASRSNEIDAAGLDDPDEDVALEAEEAAARRRRPRTATRSSRATRRSRARARRARRRASPRSTAGAPFAELARAAARRPGRARRRRARAAPRRRAGRSTTRNGSTTCARRRQLLRELGRKYGDTLADVVAYADEARARLDELEGYDARAADARVASAASCGRRGARRGRPRCRPRGAAPPHRSARAVEEHLRELAMPNATMEVEVEAGEPTDDGADEVTFLLAPNPGEAARPLAQAASGGELSRAMLAVRVVLTEAPPTLVFDEVDAGIGGEAGIAVGRCSRRWVHGTRCCASPTSRRSRRSPTRRSWWRRPWSRSRRSGSRERTDRGHAHDRRRRRAGGRALADARRRRATRRTPARHAAELLETAAAPARPSGIAAVTALMARLRLRERRDARSPSEVVGRRRSTGARRT